MLVGCGLFVLALRAVQNASQLMEVVVPAGVSSGELISFQALDGTLMEVAVPDVVSQQEAFIVDVGLESMTLSDSPQHAPAAHQVEGDAAGRELVLALVEHSARIIAIDMAWFLRRTATFSSSLSTS